jgi:hypothetical protein
MEVLYRLSYVGAAYDPTAPQAAIIAAIESTPAPPPSQPRQARWASSRIVRWIGPQNPAGVVYGVILIGALMAAEAGLHDGYPETAASAAIGVAIYWLAHAYSTILGERLVGREQLNPRGLARALGQDWAIVRGAVVPLVALLIAWLAGASQSTGATVSVWAAIACLVLLELLAGFSARAGRGERLLEVSIGIVMGIAILALKMLAA